MTGQPSMTLGTFLRTLRAETSATPKALAFRLGLDVERVRTLEQDAALPTIHEVRRMADRLPLLPHHLLGYAQATARVLLEEAWAPQLAGREAIAARRVGVPGDLSREAVLLLPLPLRTALCAALEVASPEALQQAWVDLRHQPVDYRTMVFEATVADLILEGETPGVEGDTR